MRKRFLNFLNKLYSRGAASLRQFLATTAESMLLSAGLSLASLAAYFIIRDRIPLLRGCRIRATDFPAYGIAGVSRVLCPRRKSSARPSERGRIVRAPFLRTDGNKIARGEADSPRCPRSRAREGSPFRFQIPRSRDPSPQLLLAAPLLLAFAATG